MDVPESENAVRLAFERAHQRERFMLLTATTKLASMVGAPSLSMPLAAPTGCGLMLDGLPQADDALLDLAAHLTTPLADVLKS